MNMTDANQIVGPERRTDLIRAAADRLILETSMAPDAALRYATAAYDVGDTVVLVAPGQVWRAKRGPRDAADAPSPEVVIAEVDRATGMVWLTSGGGLRYGAYLAENFDLVDWPATHPEVTAYWAAESTTDEEEGEPTESTGSDPTEDAASDDEDHLADGQLYVMVDRQQPPATDPRTELAGHLPMLSDGYVVHLGTDGRTPFTFLDVPTYLRLHLLDYRAGWHEWYTTSWKPTQGNFGILGYFNHISGECDLEDTGIAAYLGWWLHQRIRADAAREHGGTPDDYHATMCWSPASANHIVPAVPGADPTQELAPDHPLNQCAGQVDLFGLPPAA
ncbi:hypothetical protein JNW90_00830 [Micromonospora sp. STR1s_5]|nr:hypothetical protein [Micromonospora sp. STR1s_5]